MAQQKVSNKVYRVHTAVAATKEEPEELNWSSYTLVASDAEMAISFAKVRFQKSEYVLWVEFLTKLDD